MKTFYITANYDVARSPHSEPHYVVKATTKREAIDITQGYQIGYHWAVERALAGNIAISAGKATSPYLNRPTRSLTQAIADTLDD